MKLCGLAFLLDSGFWILDAGFFFSRFTNFTFSFIPTRTTSSRIGLAHVPLLRLPRLMELLRSEFYLSSRYNCKPCAVHWRFFAQVKIPPNIKRIVACHAPETRPPKRPVRWRATKVGRRSLIHAARCPNTRGQARTKSGDLAPVQTLQARRPASEWLGCPVVGRFLHRPNHLEHVRRIRGLDEVIEDADLCDLPPHLRRSI